VRDLYRSLIGNEQEQVDERAAAARTGGGGARINYAAMAQRIKADSMARQGQGGVEEEGGGVHSKDNMTQKAVMRRIRNKISDHGAELDTVR
jgi:hypothetical protein